MLITYKILIANNGNNIQDEWKNMKEWIIFAAEGVLGQKEAKRDKSQQDKEYRFKVNEKNQARSTWLSKSLNKYEEKRREANKCCKRKKGSGSNNVFKKQNKMKKIKII